VESVCGTRLVALRLPRSTPHICRPPSSEASCLRCPVESWSDDVRVCEDEFFIARSIHVDMSSGTMRSSRMMNPVRCHCDHPHVHYIGVKQKAIISWTLAGTCVQFMRACHNPDACTSAETFSHKYSPATPATHPCCHPFVCFSARQIRDPQLQFAHIYSQAMTLHCNTTRYIVLHLTHQIKVELGNPSPLDNIIHYTQNHPTLPRP
jgi:hypothetical protein